MAAAGVLHKAVVRQPEDQAAVRAIIAAVARVERLVKVTLVVQVREGLPTERVAVVVPAVRVGPELLAALVVRVLLRLLTDQLLQERVAAAADHGVLPAAAALAVVVAERMLQAMVVRVLPIQVVAVVVQQPTMDTALAALADQVSL